MAEQEEEAKGAMGPSVVLGLLGAVVVLLLLGAGVWGVGKIVSKIRESREEEETVAEEEVEEIEEGEEEVGEEEEEETVAEEGETSPTEVTEGEEVEEGVGVEEGEEEEGGVVRAVSEWVANNYDPGDIASGTYTVVWGDTLWEIAEAKYGSGSEWGKIKDANLEKIGFLPNGSRALIFPGQVFDLP